MPRYAVAMTAYAPSSRGLDLRTLLGIVQAETPEEAKVSFRTDSEAAAVIVGAAEGVKWQFGTPICQEIL